MGRKPTDFTGQIFGKLTAVKFLECKVRDGKDNHETYWLFRCECGNEISRSPFSVKRTKSPACPDCRRGDWSSGWKGCGDLSGSFYNAMLQSSKRRKLEFSLTIENLWELFLSQNSKCALSGLDLSMGTTSDGNRRTASLDRIDSSQGYKMSNIQWVHKDINMLKKDMPNDMFIEMCLLIYKNCKSGH